MEWVLNQLGVELACFGNIDRNRSVADLVGEFKLALEIGISDAEFSDE